MLLDMILDALIPIVIMFLSVPILEGIQALINFRNGLSPIARQLWSVVVGFILATVAAALSIVLPETLDAFDIGTVEALLSALAAWILEKIRQDGALEAKRVALGQPALRLGWRKAS